MKIEVIVAGIVLVIIGIIWLEIRKRSDEDN